MRKRNYILMIMVFVMMLQWTTVAAQAKETTASGLTQETAASEQNFELKIDPLLLVSLKECRNIAQSCKNEFYPGWDFMKTPILFYKPNVQEILINYPHKPEGFVEYTDIFPLQNEKIYVRNNKTIFAYDDQNTSTEIDGIPVLVVADPSSTMRNQITGNFLNQTKEIFLDWLDNWRFLASPYDRTETIFHEAFHVFQDKMAPEKSADEEVLSRYPILDPINNSFYVLEGNTLKDAVLLKEPKERMEKIKEFVAIKIFRQSRLKKEIIEYENLTEYSEGLAKYIEYKWNKIGDTVKPLEEMYYENDFNGYKDILYKRFKDKADDMVKIVSVSDNRLGNQYGTAPIRYKLYEIGAFEGLILDEIMPEWQNKIFAKGVYQFDLLKKAINLSDEEKQKYLMQAKTEYNYDKVYKEKEAFEQEGKKRLQQKLYAIYKTKNTLITISYKGYTDNVGMGYTPFGVTPIDENSAIYDMVPISVSFKDGVEFNFKKTVPVIVNKDKKEITFASNVPVSQIKSGKVNKLDNNEFIISGAKMKIKKEKNHIIINFAGI